MRIISRLACLKESQGQRGEGDGRLVGGNHWRKALKDRNLLPGKHLSLEMRQLPSQWKCNIVPWTSGMVPGIGPLEHSLEAPQGLAKVTLRTVPCGPWD